MAKNSGDSPALERRVHTDHQNYERRTQKRANKYKYQFGHRRIVYSALWTYDIKIEVEESGEIKHVQHDWWPWNVDESNRHKSLHAVQENFERLSGRNKWREVKTR